MNGFVLLLLVNSVGQTAVAVEPAHERNRIYQEILQGKTILAGSKLELPPPILKDGLNSAEQRHALESIAGSAEMTESMLRDSVTAPYILKIRDTPTETAILRHVDLWFIARGDFKEIDPLKVAGASTDKPVDVGNMRFENRLLTSEEVKASGRSTLSAKDLSSWFVTIKGRLLGRIEFQVTDEVIASRSEESAVVAARSTDGFPSGPFASRWHAIGATAENNKSQSEQLFEGGVTYTKISRLKVPADALLVEVHTVFSEPKGWFQGEPILRSKFGVVTQDQIRRLRRELLNRRAKE